jgi:hypothetical protein
MVGSHWARKVHTKVDAKELLHKIIEGLRSVPKDPHKYNYFNDKMDLLRAYINHCDTFGALPLSEYIKTLKK